MATDRRLIHYSATPLPDRLVDRSGDQRPFMKPFGLWVSAEGEDDWIAWCHSEKFGLDALACAHEIRLAPNANILRISNSAGIDELTRTYGHALLPNSNLRYMGAIDWPAVAKEYDGIVISPYIWSRRLHGGAEWYYGWDCASGCIWCPRAIAEVVSVKVTIPVTKP